MRRIILIIFAIALASGLHDTLTNTVFFLPIGELTSLVAGAVGESVVRRDAFDWGEIIIWAIILYFAIPWMGILFGFIRPRAAMFSNTKLFRYPQLVLFNVMVFGSGYILAIIGLGILALMANGSGNEIEDMIPLVADMVLAFEIDTTVDTGFYVISGIVFGFATLMGTGLVASGFEELMPKWLPIVDRAKAESGGASGRFTGYFEEAKSRFLSKEGMIFVGRSLYWPTLTIGIKDERHMLTIAGTRSGKGTSVIIPNLLLWQENAVVIDPKGTSAIVTARHRRNSFNQNVIVVDPFQITGLDSATFNPMDFLDPESEIIGDDIRLIADALVVRDKASKDPHWDDGARTVLAGLIAHVLTHPGIKDKSLPMVRNLLTLPLDQKAKLWNDMLHNPNAASLPVNAANRVLTGADTSEIQNILSNADKHTEWLTSPIMQRVLRGKNQIDFAAMRDQKTTIYFVVPLDRLESESRFIRLFVNMMIKHYTRGGKPQRKTLFIMDEFLSLGHMQEVQNATTWAAGLGLYLWPFVQSFGSFKSLYGAKTGDFLTNSRAVQVFGIDDKESNEFVSERLGERALTSVINVRRSNEVVQLRRPKDVALELEASSKLQYVMRTGKPTMLLERLDYYSSEQFAGKYDPDPDFKDAPPLTWWQKTY